MTIMENRDLRADEPLPRWLQRTQPLPQPILTPVIVDLDRDFASVEDPADRITEIEEGPDPVLASTRHGHVVVAQRARDLSSSLANQFPDMPNNASQWIEGSIRMAQGRLTQSQIIELERSSQASFASLLAFFRSKNKSLDSLPTEILLMIIQSLVRISRIQPEYLQNLSLTNRRMQELLRHNSHIIWGAFLETQFPNYKVNEILPDESQIDRAARLKQMFYRLRALQFFWEDVRTSDFYLRWISNIDMDDIQQHVFEAVQQMSEIYMRDILRVATEGRGLFEQTTIRDIIEVVYLRRSAEWLDEAGFPEIVHDMRLSHYVRLLNRATEPRRDATIRELLSSLKLCVNQKQTCLIMLSPLMTETERTHLKYELVYKVLEHIPLAFLPDGREDRMRLGAQIREVRTFVEQLGTYPLIAIPYLICQWKEIAISRHIAELL